MLCKTYNLHYSTKSPESSLSQTMYNLNVEHKKLLYYIKKNTGNDLFGLSSFHSY